MFNLLSKMVGETTTAAVSEAVSEVVTEVSKDGGATLGFTTENIGEALLCSVAGMIGIFVVVGIIILSVSLLNKLGNEKDK